MQYNWYIVVDIDLPSCSLSNSIIIIFYRIISSNLTKPHQLFLLRIGIKKALNNSCFYFCFTKMADFKLECSSSVSVIFMFHYHFDWPANKCSKCSERSPDFTISIVDRRRNRSSIPALGERGRLLFWTRRRDKWNDRAIENSTYTPASFLDCVVFNAPPLTS